MLGLGVYILGVYTLGVYIPVVYSLGPPISDLDLYLLGDLGVYILGIYILGVTLRRSTLAGHRFRVWICTY